MLCTLNTLTNAERIQRNLNAILNQQAYVSANQNFPMMNVYDSSENITVYAELPGVSKEEVSIKYENGILTLNGKRKAKDFTDETVVLRKERADGTFEKSLKIPMKINAAEVKANLKDGILKIILPKSEEARPKTIEIN